MLVRSRRGGLLLATAAVLGVWGSRDTLFAADVRGGQAPGPRAEAPAPPAPEGLTLELGVEERVRSEAWDNIIDFDASRYDERTQYRFRTRAWARLAVPSRLELVVGLNNESRKTARPDTPFKWDEVIFETLYLDYRFGPRWSARLGRQNLMRGEGLVLFDGSPLDGSRTAYLNALDIVYSAGRTKLELLAISDPHRDIYLPRLNDKTKPLVEWDERALGAYLTARPTPETALDVYYFYKTETGDARPPTDRQFQPDRTVHTIGGRIAQDWAHGWSITGELALQRGRQDALPAPGEDRRDLRAWGGYLFAKKSFTVWSAPSLSFGYLGLSGDDPGTEEIEGWDPLFSRWPKWSELYIYTLAAERGVAYWTNLSAWRAEALAKPASWLALRGTWYRMDAFEPFRGGPLFGEGKQRGDLFQARADLAAGKHWSGHVLYEQLQPGDFYSGSDSGYFLRFEVIYRLVGSFGL